MNSEDIRCGLKHTLDNESYRHFWDNDIYAYVRCDAAEFSKNLLHYLDDDTSDPLEIHILQHSSPKNDYISYRIYDHLNRTQCGNVVSDNLATRGLLYELVNGLDKLSNASGNVNKSWYRAKLEHALNATSLINSLDHLWD